MGKDTSQQVAWHLCNGSQSCQRCDWDVSVGGRDGRRGLCRSLAFRLSNFLTVGAIVAIVAVGAVVTVVIVVVVVVEGGIVATVG